MNKLELKSIGVQELDTNEMVNLDGGWFWPAAAATFLYNIVGDWNENVEAFKEGFNGN